jgi:hypothetical protein
MSLGMTSGTPLLISVAAFATMSSLVAGHGLGRGYLKGDKVTHTIKLKNDVVLFGRLIRSGERGVLFYESALKKLSFKTWADIAILERQL